MCIYLIQSLPSPFPLRTPQFLYPRTTCADLSVLLPLSMSFVSYFRSRTATVIFSPVLYNSASLFDPNNLRRLPAAGYVGCNYFLPELLFWSIYSTRSSNDVVPLLWVIWWTYGVVEQMAPGVQDPIILRQSGAWFCSSRWRFDYWLSQVCCVRFSNAKFWYKRHLRGKLCSQYIAHGIINVLFPSLPQCGSGAWGTSSLGKLLPPGYVWEKKIELAF